jgi:hypothetical protein
MVMADEVFNTLETYLKSYLVKSEPIVEDEPLGNEPDGDGLDF